MHPILFLIQSGEVESTSLSVKRGQELTRYGDVERYVYYVHSGAFCALSRIGKEEDEQVIRFGYAGGIINALSSFYSEAPSSMCVRALRASEVSRLSKAALTSYYSSDSTRQGEYIQLLENLVTQCIEREFDLLESNALTRIEKLKARSPQVFQIFPQKYIANYLRMSPETLSRLLQDS